MKDLAPSTTTAILIVDDNEDFLESTKQVLNAYGVEQPIATATNALETINWIHDLKSPAVLFVDMNLRGRMTGIALLRYARSISRHPLVAFYLSADEREDIQAAALKEGGASGYLVKPVHPERLIAHITIGTSQIETILGANHDVLTGTLLSRKEFDQRAVVELERIGRSLGQAAGIFADIDDFKQINTAWGHVVGDRVIKEVAGCFQKHLRHSDSVCRYGGDEIFMLLPETKTEAAHMVASRIERAVRRLRIDNDQDDRISVSVSLGVDFLQGNEVGNDPAEALLELERRCDKAMYLKKGQAKSG
jgi:diguanylate cyclase (GGDEF)-like protein